MYNVNSFRLSHSGLLESGEKEAEDCIMLSPRNDAVASIKKSNSCRPPFGKEVVM